MFSTKTMLSPKDMFSPKAMFSPKTMFSPKNHDFTKDPFSPKINGFTKIYVFTKNFFLKPKYSFSHSFLLPTYFFFTKKLLFGLKWIKMVKNRPNSQKWFLIINSMGWPIYQVQPGSCDNLDRSLAQSNPDFITYSLPCSALLDILGWGRGGLQGGGYRGSRGRVEQGCGGVLARPGTQVLEAAVVVGEDGPIWAIRSDYYKCNLEPFGPFWIYLEPFGSIWTHLDLFRAIESNLESIGAIWRHLEPLGAIQSHIE